MASEAARGKAAQAWCSGWAGHLIIQPELCEAFAEILDEVWSQPHLGSATTGQLLEELRARAAIDGSITYRPTDKK